MLDKFLLNEYEEEKWASETDRLADVLARILPFDELVKFAHEQGVGLPQTPQISTEEEQFQKMAEADAWGRQLARQALGLPLELPKEAAEEQSKKPSIGREMLRGAQLGAAGGLTGGGLARTFGRGQAFDMVKDPTKSGVDILKHQMGGAAIGALAGGTAGALGRGARAIVDRRAIKKQEQMPKAAALAPELQANAARVKAAQDPNKPGAETPNLPGGKKDPQQKQASVLRVAYLLKTAQETGTEAPPTEGPPAGPEVTPPALEIPPGSPDQEAAAALAEDLPRTIGAAVLAAGAAGKGSPDGSGMPGVAPSGMPSPEGAPEPVSTQPAPGPQQAVAGAQPAAPTAQPAVPPPPAMPAPAAPAGAPPAGGPPPAK